MTLLSNADSNAKTKKKLKEFRYEGVIHYMAPDKVADRTHTVCPWSTPGCRDSCLYTAGRGAMHTVQESRINKTLLWLKNRDKYLAQICAELANLEKRAAKKGYLPVARLNGTSDIPWEDYIPMESFTHTSFYDYTKSERRMWKWLAGKLPTNYYLTYSLHELTALGMVKKFTNRGANVAVVFRNEIPSTFQGIDVISGMEHDFRFRDKRGYVVGLVARGRAKHDTTGFVIG